MSKTPRRDQWHAGTRVMRRPPTSACCHHSSSITPLRPRRRIHGPIPTGTTTATSSRERPNQLSVEMIVVVVGHHHGLELGELADGERGREVSTVEPASVVREDRVDQKSVTTQGSEEGGMAEPGQPRLSRLAANEVEVRFDDGSGRAGGL